MILSDLLGKPVLTDQRIGYVTDIRFLVHNRPDGQPGQAELYGLIVSPRAKISYLGYERSGVRSPWPIAAFQRRRHRGSVLITWSDITTINTAGLHLRNGYSRYSPHLDQD